MTDESQIFEGGCLCGEVRYRAAAAPTRADYCHCRMCQKSGGAPVMAFASFRTGDVTFTRGEPTYYQSSEVARRGFCAGCGSPLVFQYLATPERMALTIASLDRAAQVVPSRHYWTSSRMPWFQVADDLPRLAEQ